MDSQVMQEEEINILELFRILKKRRRIFLLICLPAVTISIIASLLMTKIYRANAVISYTSEDGSRKLDALSGLSNLLPSMDISMGNNPGEIIKLLESRSLAEEVIKKRKLLPVFFDKKKISFFFFQTRDTEPTMWDGIRFINNNLDIEYDKASDTLEISFDFKDPEIAVDVVNEYIESLNGRLKADTVSRAQNVKKSLERHLENVEDVFLREKIYKMIVSQIEDIALSESNKYLNLKVLDPPKVPDKKIKPKRKLIVGITFLASILLSIFIILFLEYLVISKKEIK